MALVALVVLAAMVVQAVHRAPKHGVKLISVGAESAILYARG
jgi:hypothetical protein